MYQPSEQYSQWESSHDEVYEVSCFHFFSSLRVLGGFMKQLRHRMPQHGVPHTWQGLSFFLLICLMYQSALVVLVAVASAFVLQAFDHVGFYELYSVIQHHYLSAHEWADHILSLNLIVFLRRMDKTPIHYILSSSHELYHYTLHQSYLSIPPQHGKEPY